MTENTFPFSLCIYRSCVCLCIYDFYMCVYSLKIIITYLLYLYRIILCYIPTIFIHIYRFNSRVSIYIYIYIYTIFVCPYLCVS